VGLGVGAGVAVGVGVTVGVVVGVGVTLGEAVGVGVDVGVAVGVGLGVAVGVGVGVGVPGAMQSLILIVSMRQPAAESLLSVPKRQRSTMFWPAAVDGRLTVVVMNPPE
jgi:hypothetical protein